MVMKDGKVGPAKVTITPLREDSGWVVHVVGPDDVIKQDDELSALRYANAVNTHAEKERRKFANDPNYPYWIAIVRRFDDPEIMATEAATVSVGG